MKKTPKHQEIDFWSTRNWTRRDVLRVGGLGMLSAIGLTAFPHSRALAATTLTVMTVGGSWGDAIKTMIARPFAEKHGVKLAWDNRPNAQQIAAIQAMRGNPTADTAEMGGSRVGHAVSLGLLDKIDPAKAPNFARVHPSFKNDYWAARGVAPFVLVFNTEHVSKQEALEKGWDLLLDPKLKGRVAIPKFGWMGEMWLNAVNLSRGGSYDNLDISVELARKAINQNNGLVMASNDQGMKMFTSREILAAPFWTGRTYQLADKGVPLDFAYVNGWSFYGFGFSLLRGGKNQDLVTQYIDFSLSPEVQLAVARRFSYLPTLKGLEIPDDLPRVKVAPTDLDKAANIDYSQVIKYSDKHLERWNKEILG
jgi:spermidine/putrescine-binding protein